MREDSKLHPCLEGQKYLPCIRTSVHQQANNAINFDVWLHSGGSKHNTQLASRAVVSSRLLSFLLPEGPASCFERDPSCRSSPSSSSSSAPRGTSGARAGRTPRPPASQGKPGSGTFQTRGVRSNTTNNTCPTAVVTPLAFLTHDGVRHHARVPQASTSVKIHYP